MDSTWTSPWNPQWVWNEKMAGSPAKKHSIWVPWNGVGIHPFHMESIWNIWGSVKTSTASSEASHTITGGTDKTSTSPLYSKSESCSFTLYHHHLETPSHFCLQCYSLQKYALHVPLVFVLDIKVVSVLPLYPFFSVSQLVVTTTLSQTSTLRLNPLYNKFSCIFNSLTLQHLCVLWQVWPRHQFNIFIHKSFHTLVNGSVICIPYL